MATKGVLEGGGGAIYFVAPTSGIASHLLSTYGSWVRKRSYVSPLLQKRTFTYMYNASPHFANANPPRCSQDLACVRSLALLWCNFIGAHPLKQRHVCLIPVNNSSDVGMAALLWRNIPTTCAMCQYLHVEQRNHNSLLCPTWQRVTPANNRLRLS